MSRYSFVEIFVEDPLERKKNATQENNFASTRKYLYIRSNRNYLIENCTRHKDYKTIAFICVHLIFIISCRKE